MAKTTSPITISPLYSHPNNFPLVARCSIRPKLGDTQFPHLTVTPKRKGNETLLPIIKARNSPTPDYIPDAKFYKVEAIIRSWRLPLLTSASQKMGVQGVTIYDVRGFGAQGGLIERHAGKGSEFSGDMFVTKVKMETVVSKDQVEPVIKKILENARTGEIGDGKIFVMPVSDVIRVRTGERGERLRG